jgi:butyrate kinase
VIVEKAVEALQTWGVDSIDAVAARGGFIPSPVDGLPGGTYTIAEKSGKSIRIDRVIVEAIVNHPVMIHASNLGIPAAAELARRLNVPAYTVDPVVVDEFIPEARISGLKSISRVSASHALSVRAAARKASEQIGRPFNDVNLVVAHLGGGITIAAVRGGRMIDNNIALLGEGPFTPQRAGTLPLDGVLELCCSGEYSREELVEQLTRKGGLVSYLGEHRMERIEKRIADGDEEARLVVNAMVHKIIKEIGAMFALLEADVEAIVLTGGLVRSPLIQQALRRRASRLAPVFVFEESLEMYALASGVCDVLSGDARALKFPRHRPK